MFLHGNAVRDDVSLAQQDVAGDFADHSVLLVSAEPRHRAAVFESKVRRRRQAPLTGVKPPSSALVSLQSVRALTWAWVACARSCRVSPCEGSAGSRSTRATVRGARASMHTDCQKVVSSM